MSWPSSTEFTTMNSRLTIWPKWQIQALEILTDMYFSPSLYNLLAWKMYVLGQGDGMHVCCAGRGQRSSSGVIRLETSTLCFCLFCHFDLFCFVFLVSHWDLGLTNLTRLSCQDPPVSTSQHWDFKCIPPCSAFSVRQCFRVVVVLMRCSSYLRLLNTWSPV